MSVSSLSPYVIGEHFHDCGQQMRREIKRYNNGKLQSVRFYCDTCKQGFEESLIHAMGQHCPYEAPSLPEVVEDAKPKPKEPTPIKVQ